MATDLFSWDIYDFLRPQTFHALSASKKQGLLSWSMGSLILVTAVFCMSYSFEHPCGIMILVCMHALLHVHLLTFHISCLVLWNCRGQPLGVCSCAYACVWMAEDNPVVCSCMHAYGWQRTTMCVCVHVCVHMDGRGQPCVCVHVCMNMDGRGQPCVCVFMCVCMHMDGRGPP